MVYLYAKFGLGLVILFFIYSTMKMLRAKEEHSRALWWGYMFLALGCVGAAALVGYFTGTPHYGYLLLIGFGIGILGLAGGTIYIDFILKVANSLSKLREKNVPEKNDAA